MNQRVEVGGPGESRHSQGRGEIRVRQLGPLRIITYTANDLSALGGTGLGPPRAVQEAALVNRLLSMAAVEQRRPITRAAVASLPTHELTQEDITAAQGEQKACSICMEEFAVGDKQRTMPCFHRFHQACLDEWLTRNGTCPICKFDVDSTGQNFQEEGQSSTPG
mmetsp:Transcript_6442/g.11513  ORF Transcript_6442/g.11513 Transcript_6442/m.11513 type:complete len:165 (-) Transcript_6442:122-616(-)